MKNSRRKFIKDSALTAGILAVSPAVISCSSSEKESTSQETGEIPAAIIDKWDFDISLAEWSFHRALRNNEFDNLAFPIKAKELGINAVEYVSRFFNGQSENQDYLNQLKTITSDNGIDNVLIMVDGEGGLGDTDEAKRIISVENHYKWIEAAKFLGCHSIRVNAYGQGTSDEVKSAAIDGLGRLSEYGASNKINVIVENHGGYSSDGKWLIDVIRSVNNPYCGTLPDFGNFKISDDEFYDQYKGVEEMMEFAKGVSAKSHDFTMGEDSNTCTGSGNVPDNQIDFERMLTIVKNAGYTGYVGIEYEGMGLPESEYITKTKVILERVREKLG